ncbi:MAG: hypothetical protein BroJett013_12730 [Alphaproteobacteria bacterium]|nr:MAG: hypothetical protein BroJett013_12730 [Alphaproteobacteria bacterium]
MSHILRVPAILVLLALVLLSALGALAAAGILTGYQAPVEQVQSVQAAAAESGAAEATWIDVGLLAAAAVFFLISSIRLMRRTQGFWTWLLGFAAYGGRWAWDQQQSGGLLETIRNVDLGAYANPQAVLGDLSTTEGQLAILALILIVGVVVLMVDAADRAYWDKQGA